MALGQRLAGELFEHDGRTDFAGDEERVFCLASGYDAALVLKVCQVRCSWLREGRFGVASVRLDAARSAEIGTKFSTEFSEQGPGCGSGFHPGSVMSLESINPQALTRTPSKRARRPGGRARSK